MSKSIIFSSLMGVMLLYFGLRPIYLKKIENSFLPPNFLSFNMYGNPGLYIPNSKSIEVTLADDSIIDLTEEYFLTTKFSRFFIDNGITKPWAKGIKGFACDKRWNGDREVIAASVKWIEIQNKVAKHVRYDVSCNL